MKSIYQRLSNYLAAFNSSLSLKRIDAKKIEIKKDQILLFAVCRNEERRLPYFFQHYKKLGVEHFFIIDNCSDDQSQQIISKHENAYLFNTEQSFQKSRFGSLWVMPLLKKYAVNHWCIVVDIDEFFVYPEMERLSLKNFCSFLDKEQSTCVESILIDMYNDKPLSTDTTFNVIDNNINNLLELSPYFDCDGYNDRRGFTVGGPRARVFGMHPDLDKYPLIKFNTKIKVQDGWHDIDGAKYSNLKAALLHFKFLDDFYIRALIEAKREQHWRNATEYKEYIQKLNENKQISFMYEGSKRYLNSNSLKDHNLICSSQEINILTQESAKKT